MNAVNTASGLVSPAARLTVLEPFNIEALPDSENGGSRLRFHARSNLTWTVEFTEDIARANWQTLTNLASAATNRLVELIDSSASGGKRFYRLGTPRFPDTLRP